MGNKLKVRFTIHDDGLLVDMVAVGRDGWALLELVRAGSAGLTTLTNPAPRWSHYIYKLRRMGVDIETQDERHEGQFAGSHGRYRLRSDVRIIDVEGAEWRAAA